jgi:hypothetical protein
MQILSQQESATHLAGLKASKAAIYLLRAVCCVLPVLCSVSVIELLTVTDAAAQTAQISGVITDSSGAVVPKASVRATNSNTGISGDTDSSGEGYYAVPLLQPGIYVITVSAPGFTTQIQSGIILEVGTQQVLNFKLQVGQLSQSVQVTGAAPMVQLASSVTDFVVNSKTVVDLPLNGRDWTQLATLQPGVSSVITQQPNGANANRGNRGYGAQVSISGTRPQTNNYRLDGISLVDYAGGSPGSVLGIALGVDAVAEFSVLTANQSAEYGRTAGGVVNAVTRSGTNQIHGDAYWFLRDEGLDAEGYFDTSRPPFHRNQFGASAGGPIKKDKTFFFADYEGFRQDLSTTIVDKVPSPDARNGIIHNANGTSCTIGVPAPGCSLVNSAGTVGVDPLVKPFLNLYPLPNAGLIGAGNTGTFNVATNSVSTENFVTARIDQKVSDKDSLFGTWYYDSGFVDSPDALNTVNNGNTSGRDLVALNETHAFSPALLNSVRLGYNRVATVTSKSLNAINPLAADTSLGSYPGRAAPQISVSGLTAFAGGIGGLTTLHHTWNSYQVYDDLFWTTGAHSLKFGFVAERMQHNMLAPSKPNGVFSFGSLTSFLENTPLTFVGLVPGTFQKVGARQSLFGGYIQDDWRLRPYLTLNLGLRYEMVTVPTEVRGRISNLHTFTAPYPGHLGSPYFLNPTLRNFEPRIGFSWDPLHNGKTAVRGAFGIFDSLPLNYEFIFGEDASAPFASIITLEDLEPGAFPTEAANNTTVNPSELQVWSSQFNPPRNYVMIWNLNIQHQLTPNTAVTVGYVGNHGVHMLNRADDANVVLPALTSAGYLWPFPAGSGTRLNPGVGDIRGLYWTGGAEYDALNVQVSKRMSYGFQAEGSYTWGKNIDTGSASVIGDPFTNSISSPLWFCSSCRRGLSDFNIAQKFVANYIWDAPAPKEWGAVGSHLLGGWEVGGIFTAESGVPITPLIGGDPLGENSNDPYAYPNRLKSPSGCHTAVNPGHVTNYINLNCFTLPMATPAIAAQCTPFNSSGVPIPGTCQNLLGNSGRNSVIGPRLVNLDFSLFKNNYFPKISDSFNAQFRAEFFNVLNHPSFGPPVDNETIFDQQGAPEGGAGALNQLATTGREIQFAVKLIW